MERKDGEPRPGAAPGGGRGPRWVFQVGRNEGGPVLRVLDTHRDAVFREIPIAEFLAYARTHRNVTPWLLGKLPGAGSAPGAPAGPGGVPGPPPVQE